MREQSRRGQTTVGHARGGGRHHRRQRAILPSHVFGPHRFAPEKFGGLEIQLPADFLVNAFPVLRRGLDFVGLNDFAHHFQVLWGNDPLRSLAGAARSGRGRERLLRGRFHDLLGESGQEQLQLSRVQGLTLLSKQTPGQRVKFLTQECIFNARLFERLAGLIQRLTQQRVVLLQQGHLLLEQLGLSLQRGGVHRI